ncbi:hypothetical protein N9C18_01315 [Planktomarina temperata]|nr:hypothetical protein [Planktomarina temperata]
MISFSITFTCGTYHGLFVDTGVPSVLPKDKSFFDFRTKGGRAIPEDSSPNLVLRYVRNVDTETHMLMVSLVYLAVEGSREGFIAFGALLHGPSFTSHEIEKGIKSAIDVARGASSFFNGKIITGRPVPIDGETLDLINLPLGEGNKFYGELVSDIDSEESIKELSKFSHDLISSEIDHYEIVVNPRRGMRPNDLWDHFEYIVSREKYEIEERREKLKKLRDKQRLDEFLTAQRLIDRRERNSILLQVLAFGIALTALVALVIFLLAKFWFTENQAVDTQPSNTNGSMIDTRPISEIDLASGDDSSQSPEDVEAANCNLETLSLDDQSKAMIITDLPTEGRCISISDSVTSVFDTKPLDQIITSTISGFKVTDNFPEPNQRLLTSFRKVIDSASASGPGSKYINEGKKFVLPDPSLSFSISMETVSPKLICSAAVSEKDAFIDDFPTFEYYTKSQNDYQEIIKWFSEGVLLRLGQAYQQIGEEIKTDDPSNLEVVSAANRLRDFGNNLSDLVASDKLMLATGKLDQDQKTCVILTNQEDEMSFYSRLTVPAQTLPTYSMKSFLQAHANVAEKYDELVGKKSLSECHKIPGLFMVWNAGDGAAMVMENAVGFTPYTERGGQDFAFDLRLSKYYGSPNYRLPKLDKFDDLKTYFEADPDFSPFLSELYSQENFCFAPTSVDP